MVCQMPIYNYATVCKKKYYMYRRNYTHIKNNVFTTKQSRPSTVYMKKIKIIQSINKKAHD